MLISIITNDLHINMEYLMNRFSRQLPRLALLLCLVLISTINVSAKDIPVYKGTLRVTLLDEGEGSTLLLQYLTKTREVLRIGVSDAVMINNMTRRVIRLPDITTSIAPDQKAGYLYADIEYGDLELSGDNYRVEGNLTVYLARGQQSRHFRIYLNHGPVERPANSTIDWGIDNPARSRK